MKEAVTPVAEAAPAAGRAGPRLASIDVFRGAIMFLILAEMIDVCAVAHARPGSGFWTLLCRQQTHAEWVGCTLHDLIQPGFSFLVGVVLPFSLASRRRRGASNAALLRHALVRSVLLVALGVAIISIHLPGILWIFIDTLAQIGLAYPFLFGLALCRPRTAWWAFGAILVGYWLFFALTPLPPAGFDFSTVGVPPDWMSAHGLTGFYAHWQKNLNAAANFDRWFLNLFPRREPYVGLSNGLTTLNFVPLIATMILGLWAGRVLTGEREPRGKVWALVAGGLAATFAGVALHRMGVCPIVKAIWTPSWVLFSGGLSLLILALSYVVVDLAGVKRPFLPFTVIGMNSITAYCLDHFFPAYAFNSLRRVVGWKVFRVFGAVYEPVVYGACVVACLWVVLFVMYRRKLFLRL